MCRWKSCKPHRISKKTENQSSDAPRIWRLHCCFLSFLPDVPSRKMKKNIKSLQKAVRVTGKFPAGLDLPQQIRCLLRHLLRKKRNIGTIKTNRSAQLNDMYPLYWTPSRGGIIMRYTYEYKRKCVELYREGKWPETPEGVSNKSFRDKVRLWVRAEDSRGPEALKHKNFNRNWTPEERLELVSQVMSGKSCVSVAIEAGIQDRLLYQWVQNYKTKGYNGLVEMKKGRPSKGVPQMKKEEARPLNESEREELIRLRAENEYIKAENEVIKKEIALREERHAAQLKARKQRSSKSCVKKDTN